MASKINPLISAWVGRGNFGDELLSYGLRLELRAAYDVERFSYYDSGGFPVFSAGVEDCSSFLNFDRGGRFQGLYRRYLQSINGYDSFFFGGGSVFHSRNSVSWKRQLLKKFRRSNKSSVAAAVGVSLGPFMDSYTEKLALELLADLDLVHCRDAVSTEFAQQANGGVKVVQGRDLAFSVKALHAELFVANPVKGRVGVSFILSPRLTESERSQQYLKMLALVDFFSLSGFEVLLVGLYSGNKYADHLLNQRLFREAKDNSRIRLVHYADNLAGILAVISSCSFYISMRLHGVVSAFLSGVPFFALSSHSKVLEFCDSVDELGEESGRGDLGMELPLLIDRVYEAYLRQAEGAKVYSVECDKIYLAGSLSLKDLLQY